MDQTTEQSEHAGQTKKEFIANRLIRLLLSTQRPGIDRIIEWLGKMGFFDSPASTKYHGCYPGGLAEHSLNVYELLAEYNHKLRLGCPQESVVIAALLHDVCKVGAYISVGCGYSYNPAHPAGHAMLSLSITKGFIELTELEEKMIRYHMGVYGLKEFDERKGEYRLRGQDMANAWYHWPIVKVIYFCDELATLLEKAKESGEAGEGMQTLTGPPINIQEIAGHSVAVQSRAHIPEGAGSTPAPANDELGAAH